MAKFLSFKSKDISWKRVGLIILIFIIVILLIFLSFWYFMLYRPEQESIQELKRMDEIGRAVLIQKGLPLPDFLKTEPEF